MVAEFAYSFNKEVLAKEYDTGTYTVSRELILNYARAVGETNPLYIDEDAASAGPFGEIVAPPTLPITFVDDWEPPDLCLSIDGTLYLAGQWVEPLAPIKAGDTLRAISRVKRVYAKTGRSGPMVFVDKETSFTNQRGVEVARVGCSNVWRRADTG